MNAPIAKEQMEKEKEAAARAAVRWVRSGMQLGLGTGSTADYFIEFLGERVRREGLKISAVASSAASEAVAAKAGIPLVAPRRGLVLDLAVDGADEIAPDLALIKGRGAALIREKVVAQASRFFLVIADSTKRVQRLGNCGLPVEVVPFAMPWVLDRVAAMGGHPGLLMDRKAPGRPAMTDQQNYVLDCRFGEIADPADLAACLEKIPGVGGHGLFLTEARAALVASGSDVVVLRRGLPARPASEFDSLPDEPR